MTTRIHTDKPGRPRNDLTGQRFGKLTVVELANDHGTSWWKCQCDCGAEKNVRAAHLVNGGVRSCGCGRTLPNSEAARNSLYIIYRSGAKNRNHTFTLSLDQFAEITQMPCHYCGQSPSQIHQPPNCNGPYIYQGIDRKDNTQGYDVDNCLPCCQMCNRMKSSLTYEQFTVWIARVIDHWT